MTLPEEADEHEHADEREHRRDERQREVRGAVEALGEQQEDDRDERPRELEPNDRVAGRPAHAEPEAREQPEQQHGRTDQPDVHGTSFEAWSRSSAWRSARSRSQSASTNITFGLIVSAMPAIARRPREPGSLPPASNGVARYPP